LIAFLSDYLFLVQHFNKHFQRLLEILEIMNIPQALLELLVSSLDLGLALLFQTTFRTLRGLNVLDEVFQTSVIWIDVQCLLGLT